MTDDRGAQAPARGIPLSRIRPLKVPMLRVVEVGLACWALALVVILVVPPLHEGNRSSWPWTCVAGLVLGSGGWAYLRRGRGNASDA
ncbi:MAG: hypothetical protein JWP82_1232 [Humibacillus sp.]|nr:hypothetical protein [Humibacillus sp.]